MADPLAGPEACMICYDLPELYGLLENCDHPFCYECIRHWREPSWNPARARNPRSTADEGSWPWPSVPPPSGLAVPELIRGAPEFHEGDDETAERDGPRNKKTCPLCSKPSVNIYKAVKFPKTIKAKTAIVNGCKAEWKRQLCRDFEASIAMTGEHYCPRFNDCQYAHLKTQRKPNEMARTDPYIFSDEEIGRLKLQRDVEYPLAELRASIATFIFMAGTSHPIIATHIEDMLSDVFETAHSDTNVMARQLILDFFSCYLNHAERLIEYAWDYSPARIYTVFSSSSENPRLKWNLQIKAHKYHYFDDSGNDSVIETIDASRDLRRFLQPIHKPGFIELRETLPEYNSDDSVVLHHFVAPVGSEPSVEQRESWHAILRKNQLEIGRIMSRPPSEDAEEHHIYHIWNEELEHLATLGGTDTHIHNTFPSAISFSNSQKRQHYSLGHVSHHFLSMLDPEEAKTVIEGTPDFYALMAAIDAQSGRPPAGLDPATTLHPLFTLLEYSDIEDHYYEDGSFDHILDLNEMWHRLANNEMLDDEWTSENDDSEEDHEQMPDLVRVDSAASELTPTTDDSDSEMPALVSAE